MTAQTWESNLARFTRNGEGALAGMAGFSDQRATPDRKKARAVFAFIVANPGEIVIRVWTPKIQPKSTANPTAAEISAMTFESVVSRRSSNSFLPKFTR